MPFVAWAWRQHMLTGYLVERAFYILGSCALLVAGAILCRWADERGLDAPEVEAILSRPGAIQAFQERCRGDSRDSLLRL